MRKMLQWFVRPRREAAWLAVVGAGVGVAAVVANPINTTLLDFFLAGSQPGILVEEIATAEECMGCHSYVDPVQEPGRPWAASMMGQSARDPVFHAALAIANQDAAFAGDLCLRCHTPGGWIEEHSTPTNGSALQFKDFQGVSCNVCHRMVDPVYRPGISPLEDEGILASVGTLPPNPHSGNFVIDPYDRRRGPHDLGPFFPAHYWLQAPFQGTSNMCATCHDVSNPVYDRQPDGTYALGPLNTPHATGDKYQQFPMERTYSEWSRSEFAAGPVNVNGRFGGNLAAVSSCQDCHMPPTEGRSCGFGEFRPNLRQHHFNGGNTWVLRAVRELYPDSETFLNADTVDDSIARAEEMLRLASDMELSFDGPLLNVRIINHTGHKLPTGYPEGRRMWINVQFLDSANTIIAERGAYDTQTATLNTTDTKVYEGKQGVDAAVAAATGIQEGPGFHFAVNNLWYSDNRIPPRGFTNAGFAEVQSAPVNYTYADGQHWDDTQFTVPQGAANVRVTVYYQSTSKEYIEFLRDYNETNQAGQTAYDQWVLAGKSAPAVMDTATVAVPCYANCDGSTIPPILNVSDFICFQNKYAAADPTANCDGSTIPPVLNVSDFICFLQKYAAGCP